MADRIISIEIGQRITRVCETEYKGQPQVHQFFSFETPEGVLENQMIKESAQFRAMLTSELKKHKIKTKKVIFAISSMGIGTKEEQIPDMKEARLKDYLDTNITTFFPVKPEEYKLTYRINGPGEPGKNRVQLYAVNKNIITSYEELAKACGLQLVDLEFVDNGVAQTLRKYYPKGVVLSLRVEESYCAITVVKDGVVALQRNVAYGLDECIEELQEKNVFGEMLSYQQILEKMKETCVFYPSFAAMEESQIKDPIRDTATEELRYLLGNIRRIMEYYVSQNHQDNFSHLFLTGLGSGCAGLSELLQSETGYTFETVPEALATEKGIQRDAIKMSAAFPVMAVAVNPIGVGIPKKNAFSLENLVKDQEDLSTAKKFFALCILIVVVLIAIPVSRSISLGLQEKSLQRSIASMAEAKKVNDQYQKVKNQYEELLVLTGTTRTPNDALLQLFQEMEHQIPTDAIIEEMVADEEGVSIQFIVPDKKTAAKTIQVFRDFESISDVSVDEMLIIEESDATTGGYRFVLQCYYQGVGAPAEEDAQVTESQESTEENPDGLSSDNITEGTASDEATEGQASETTTDSDSL